MSGEAQNHLTYSVEFDFTNPKPAIITCIQTVLCHKRNHKSVFLFGLKVSIQFLPYIYRDSSLHGEMRYSTTSHGSSEWFSSVHLPFFLYPSLSLPHYASWSWLDHHNSSSNLNFSGSQVTILFVLIRMICFIDTWKAWQLLWRW